MSQFVRTTGGLLQLKSGSVNEKDVAKVREFAVRLGFETLPKGRNFARAELRRDVNEGMTPERRAFAIHQARKQLAEMGVKDLQDELQDLQAKEPEAFR